MPDISDREALSAVSMNRLITGVRLQKRLDIPIIISGGQVFADSGTEATVAEKVLLELSVPPQQILLIPKQEIQLKMLLMLLRCAVNSSGRKSYW